MRNWIAFSAYPVLEEEYYQVLISYSFRRQLIVPASSYRKNDGGLLISTLLGNSGSVSVVSEAIPEWQLYNVYAVPDIVHDRLRRQFPKATFRHQQSLELRNTNAGIEQGCLRLILPRMIFQYWQFHRVNYFSQEVVNILLLQMFYTTYYGYVISFLSLNKMFNCSYRV